MQAERWGARLETEDVVSVDLSSRPFTVTGTDTTVKAHSVIVATGATAKRLGLPSEQRFWSSGISACAICDGASAVFKGQELAVVGGGDTATEEAVYLTKYGSHVSATLGAPSRPLLLPLLPPLLLLGTRLEELLLLFLLRRLMWAAGGRRCKESLPQPREPL